MVKSLNTNDPDTYSLDVTVRRLPFGSLCLFTNTVGGLFPSTLPRQTLHEATGNSSDDDDAHKQGRGHADDQGDEEQVSNWRVQR